MPRNLKIIFRFLAKYRSQTLINVFGLALGIACSLILFLLIDFELSFDTYHRNYDNVYRVTQHMQRQDGLQENAGVQYPMGKALRTEFPSLVEVAMVEYHTNSTVTIAQDGEEYKKFTGNEGVAFVEPPILNMLDFTPLHGNLEQALDHPNSAIISALQVMKYFDLERDQLNQAIGKSLVLNNELDLIVNAIIEDIPENSDFPFSIMVPFASLRYVNNHFDENNWKGSSVDTNCYFLAPDNFDKAGFESNLIPFINKYRGEGASDLRRFRTQPLSDIHFDDRFSNYRYRVAGWERIWAMAAIAVVLILTASINFINLAASQATTRLKEVSILKIMGCSNRRLFVRLFSENLMITFFAMLVALVVAELMIINFDQFIYLGRDFSLFSTGHVYLFLLIIGLFVGLLSGLYPALSLSRRLQLSGVVTSGQLTIRHGGLAQKVMVTSQFVITQMLIIGTLVMDSQLDYFHNKPLGFESSARIAFPLPDNSAEKLHLLRAGLALDPRIDNLSFTLGQPQTDNYFETHFGIGNQERSQEYRTEFKPADAQFFDVFGLKFLAGDKYVKEDSLRNLVVNRTMMLSQGYENPEDIIGQPINIFGEKYPVVGVVEDFNSRPLHEQIRPLVIAPSREFYYEGILKIHQANTSGKELASIISFLESTWKEVYPEEVFSSSFVEDNLALRYEYEEKASNLLQIFAGVAIMIGILGLYGLVSFLAVQKVKEIGIRKVLGAGIRAIVLLFTSQFMKLMAIAFLIAAPVGTYLISGWLENFANRITVGPEHYLLTITFSFIVILIAIGYKSLRAALANPVNSLRNE